MGEMREADEARAAPHPGDLDSKPFQLKEELNSPGLKRGKGHSRQRDSMSNGLDATEHIPLRKLKMRPWVSVERW